MASSSKDEVVKRMAELLKSGATMLNDSCPYCHVPLFKLKSGDIICPSCGRRIIYVKEGEEIIAEGIVTLEELRVTILKKLKELNYSMLTETDPERLHIQTKLLLALLDALERVAQTRSTLSSK